MVMVCHDRFVACNAVGDESGESVMRKWLISLVSMLMISTIYAYSGFGVCNYGREVVSSVVCYSPAVLKQTIVQGDLKITGSLQAEDIVVQSMVVNGNVSLQNSQVNGEVNITGQLQADHVNFQKGVAVVGDMVMLNHSKVNGLMTITSTQDTPTLEVLCSSVITGSVLFDGKPGIIKMTASDSAVQGKIINGSTIFVEQKCQ